MVFSPLRLRASSLLRLLDVAGLPVPHPFAYIPCLPTSSPSRSPPFFSPSHFFVSLILRRLTLSRLFAAFRTVAPLFLDCATSTPPPLGAHDALDRGTRHLLNISILVCKRCIRRPCHMSTIPFVDHVIYRPFHLSTIPFVDHYICRPYHLLTMTMSFVDHAICRTFQREREGEREREREKKFFSHPLTHSSQRSLKPGSSGTTSL